MEQTIRIIIATLEGIKAEGPDNWNRLLACDQALKEMLAKMEAQKNAEKPQEKPAQLEAQKNTQKQEA